VGQTVVVLWIVAMFLFRHIWFLYFELGPRGATPGKRALGLRVAARDGGRLTTEAVVARNILRDIELTLPIIFVTSTLIQGEDATFVAWAGAAWFLIFAFFPCFNRDALRAGDVVAGTWVVEAGRDRLKAALSVAGGALGKARSRRRAMNSARRNCPSMANTSFRCWSACCARTARRPWSTWRRRSAPRSAGTAAGATSARSWRPITPSCAPAWNGACGLAGARPTSFPEPAYSPVKIATSARPV
jgi:uncharacterized RDD family membrane protein YckC